MIRKLIIECSDRLKEEKVRKSKNKKEGLKMEWQIIVILVVAVPLILIPVVFTWFLNISGILTVLRDQAKKKLQAAQNKVFSTAN